VAENPPRAPTTRRPQHRRRRREDCAARRPTWPPWLTIPTTLNSLPCAPTSRGSTCGTASTWGSRSSRTSGSSSARTITALLIALGKRARANDDALWLLRHKWFFDACGRLFGDQDAVPLDG
jgi:hypothetical protein